MPATTFALKRNATIIPRFQVYGALDGNPLINA
jgi:hypothetical protein